MRKQSEYLDQRVNSAIACFKGSNEFSISSISPTLGRTRRAKSVVQLDKITGRFNCMIIWKNGRLPKGGKKHLKGARIKLQQPMGSKRFTPLFFYINDLLIRYNNSNCSQNCSKPLPQTNGIVELQKNTSRLHIKPPKKTSDKA